MTRENEPLVTQAIGTPSGRLMHASIDLHAHLTRERELHAAVDSQGAQLAHIFKSIGPGAEPQTTLGQERTVSKLSTTCFAVTAALLATAAFAQPPQSPSGGSRPTPPGASSSPQPGGPTTTGQAPQPSAGGPRGEVPPRGEGPPPPSKAAHFRVEHGDDAVDVKCADDEPTRACADIAMQLLDRLGITQARTTGSAPQR